MNFAPPLAPADTGPRLAEAFARRVRDLLARHYGYAPRDAALPHMQHVIAARRGTASNEEYWRRLEQSADTDPESELHVLLESLLNHETELGRTPPHFTALRKHILPALLLGPPRRLRLASLGCATGEEAYTLAATAAVAAHAHAKNAGSPPAARPLFDVTGLDISRRALATARAGHYGPDVSAELDPVTREWLLEPDPTGYRIRFELAAHVRFSPHNLLKPLPLVGLDVAFCRNVLIYFSAENARRVLGHIHAALAPGGWLFLGHAESALAYRDWFEPVAFPETLAYRRR